VLERPETCEMHCSTEAADPLCKRLRPAQQPMREPATSRFRSVLLTRLSSIQAPALEALWSSLHGGEYPWTSGMGAVHSTCWSESLRSAARRGPAASRGAARPGRRPVLRRVKPLHRPCFTAGPDPILRVTRSGGSRGADLGPTLFDSLRPRVIRFGLLLRLLEQVGSQGLLATRSIEERPMTDETMPKESFPAMNPVHCRAVMGLRRVARRRPAASIFSCVWPIVGRVKRPDDEAEPADGARSPFLLLLRGRGVGRDRSHDPISEALDLRWFDAETGCLPHGL